MTKSWKAWAAGALCVAALGIGIAAAAVGTPPIPGNGPGLVDGAYLRGLAGGVNYSYQYNFTAAGTNQATATQLPTEKYLLELDTVASGTGAALPACIQGTQVFVFNNGANTATIYPMIANNFQTGAQDTINGGTSTTIASKAQGVFSCAKTGVWGAK